MDRHTTDKDTEKRRTEVMKKLGHHNLKLDEYERAFIGCASAA